MRLALLSDGISPFVIGGMQQHSASLAINFVKAGYKVDLFHFVDKSQKLPSAMEVNNILFDGTHSFENIFCCYFPTSIRFPGHYLFNSYRYSKWIYEIIKGRNEYDFIYAKGFSAWKLLINKKALNKNTKVGIKFHGYEMFQYAPNFKIKLQHFMLRPFVKSLNINADFVFSYGGKITNIINNLGVPKRKIIEIPSAIDASWLKSEVSPPSNVVKFLYVGRYERRKGIEELNQSILELSSQSKKNVEFHFLGPIPEIKKLKVHNLKTVYYGLVKDVLEKKKIYDSCDVLLCPSFSEGMPNVILEGMARGLAIITSNVGAISLMVSEKNGFILERINSHNINTAITEISMNLNNLYELKKNSINKMKSEFTWDVILNSFNSKIEIFQNE